MLSPVRVTSRHWRRSELLNVRAALTAVKSLASAGLPPVGMELVTMACAVPAGNSSPTAGYVTIAQTWNVPVPSLSR